MCEKYQGISAKYEGICGCGKYERIMKEYDENMKEYEEICRCIGFCIVLE